MRLSIRDKANLRPEHANHLKERLGAPEHQNDVGPCRVWHVYQSGLYAFVLNETGLPIGIAEASGPSDAVNAGWWIDSEFRGRGYGNELIDLLAPRLKQCRYTGAGTILVTTHRAEYDEPSRKLKQRFLAHFRT